MVFSLQKLLGLLAVIWLVWTVFRFFEMRQKKQANQNSNLDTDTPSDVAGVSENESDNASVDLQECNICGTWFSGKTCEQESCQM